MTSQPGCLAYRAQPCEPYVVPRLVVSPHSAVRAPSWVKCTGSWPPEEAAACGLPENRECSLGFRGAFLPRWGECWSNLQVAWAASPVLYSFCGRMGAEGTESRPTHPNSELQRWHLGVGERLKHCHHPGNGAGLKHVCLLKITVFLAPEQFQADLNAWWIMITFTAERSQRTSAQMLFKHTLTGSVCLFFF